MSSEEKFDWFMRGVCVTLFAQLGVFITTIVIAFIGDLMGAW